MNESHLSTELDYEVTGKEELNHAGTYRSRTNERSWARMTGAGFGGCAIALVPGPYQAFD